MHECYHANDRLVKAPHPKHSVKGVGKTYPNPQQSTILNDVEVPLGQALVNENFPGTLLYNEYPFVGFWKVAIILYLFL